MEICSKSLIETAIITITDVATIEKTGVFVVRLMVLNKPGSLWSLAIAKEVRDDAITAVLIEESVAKIPAKANRYPPTAPPICTAVSIIGVLVTEGTSCSHGRIPLPIKNTEVLIRITAAIEIKIALGIVFSGSITSSLAVVINPYPIYVIYKNPIALNTPDIPNGVNGFWFSISIWKMPTIT